MGKITHVVSHLRAPIRLTIDSNVLFTGIPLLIASCFKVSLRDTEIIISLLCLLGGRRHKSTVQYATRPDLPKLAYRRVKGKSPGVVFLPGYGSNMNGQKAEALEEFCRSLGHSYLRLVIQK